MLQSECGLRFTRRINRYRCWRWHDQALLTTSTFRIYVLARTGKVQEPGSEVSFSSHTLSSIIRPQVSAFAPTTNLNNAIGKSALRMAEKTNIPGPPYSGPASKPILDSVKFPSDMKKLSLSEIKQVRNL